MERTALWVEVVWIHGRGHGEGHNGGKQALGECVVGLMAYSVDHLDGWRRLGSERDVLGSRGYMWGLVVHCSWLWPAPHEDGDKFAGERRKESVDRKNLDVRLGFQGCS